MAIRTAPGALLPVLFLALMSVGLGACGNGETPASADRTGPYRIVATTGMVTDVVREVAGDRADVTGIIGEGVDPHLYKPTRSDVAALLEADVVFYSGLHLEGKMGDTLVKIARQDKPVYALTEELDEAFLLEPPEFEGHYDPHVWMDVSAWSQTVDIVARTLAEFDPDGRDGYESRARAYAERLTALDAYAKKSVSSIPEKSRILVTAHDAFNYFGRAYGVEVRGIQGISTESEAGLEDINRLVDLLVDRDIRAVFVESSVASKNVEALIEGARSRGHEVIIGGELFSDAMGTPGTYTGTYLGMIDHNVTTLSRALGGDAPEKGFQGELASDGAADG